MKKPYRSLAPIIPWNAVDRPLEGKLFFGRIAPLEVEIGFGNGGFLIQRAQDSPEKDFLGIELEWASVRRALRKIAVTGLGNVRLLLADARFVFDYLLPPQALQRIYSLFPMPWPKDRHAKHRLFSRRFLTVCNNRLKTGGELHIVTDHEPYKYWIGEQLPGTGFAADVTITPPLYGTKYENKWCDQGRSVFYEVHLVKQEHKETPVKEDTLVKTLSVETFDPDNFKPTDERGETVVEFKEFLYDPKKRKGMLKTLVVEDAFPQYVWIEIVYGDGRWYIHVARNSGVLPTRGVQRAVELVAEAAGS